MPTNQKKVLNNHLTLHGWLNSHFGYRTTRDLLHDVAPLDEGFTPEGHSPICEFLMSRPDVNPDVETALPTYDANIQKHLSAINDRRTQPIVLRYFQYLALLYAEIFLDWKFNRRDKLRYQLNDFVETCNNAKDPADPKHDTFTKTDIEKLAFWMATGAGKTLIMHINYHQYLHYCKETLDHVVLVTPNAGLSEQHILEMRKSGIPCELFNVEGNRTRNSNTVQVIEITKLVDEKTGEGESVPVEAFEGRNLVFVDEGHKGTRSEDAVWRDRRKKLSENGFTFEYSATFGQALAAAKNDDLVDEYGKAIAFDYSYRYFYTDGYGKNFRILNVKHDEETQTETLLLGNLLSFYEQRRYFKENIEAARTYGLELPLWTFVGSRVNANAVYTERRTKRSDVLNIVCFLNRFLTNEDNWAIQTIGSILNGDSGLRDENGVDVFHDRLNTLKNLGTGSEDTLYADILREVFHTTSSGPLQLRDVRNAPGEIALKTISGGEFGLINIGDISAFKKLLKAENANIDMDLDDVITDSLFSSINTPDSRINILIGAKKFIEGWDSWRVSTMGLLNVGTNEGSQIIQLFGRGVRLRGKHMSLKRSTSKDTERPPNLPLLETLNIFAVRANFMARFREYLKHEDVEHVQLEVPIKNYMDEVPDTLYTVKVPRYDEIAKGECVKLGINSRAKITHTTQSVEIIGSSSQTGIQSDQAKAARQRTIKSEFLEIVDWEKIYLQLLEYKQEKKLHNLIFDTAILRQILCPDQDPSLYELYVMNETEVMPKTRAELEHLETLVLTLLRKYISKFYRLIRKRWNDDRIEPEPLKTQDNPNFIEKWEISVPQDDAQEIQEHITRLVEDGGMYDGRYRNLGRDGYPIVYNDRHLYLPLLAVGTADKVWRAAPPALVDSEKDFVEDVFAYARAQNEGLLAGKEMFLLRNQSRGKGIGFYDNVGFYPDFVLWITTEHKQRIVFIEPHGMFYETIDENNLKVTLFKRLHTLSINERFRQKQVEMDSFVISKTPYERLRHNRRGMNKQELEEDWHILFREHGQLDYLHPIFKEPEFVDTSVSTPDC